MKSLDEIMVTCESDKATAFTRTYAKPKGYTIHYERLFAPLRMVPIKLIEIGAAGGESIRAWLEFFPSAQVWGIDIVKDTNPWNTVNVKTHPRYTFIHANQSDPVMWACLAADTGGNWDIVVDDGSHCSKDIFTSFEAGWQFIRSGGYWAVEDLGCGYTPGSVFITGMPDHKSWLHAIVDRLMMGANDIDSAYFANELIILRKK